MKVLVTGGCGFLGTNIAASYLEKGAEVVTDTRKARDLMDRHSRHARLVPQPALMTPLSRR